MTMIEESRNWARLTMSLDLYNASFLRVRLVDNVDYPLCFHTDKFALRGSDGSDDALIDSWHPNVTGSESRGKFSLSENT